MKILPDGNVEITNGDTGEVRVVSPGDLPRYGIQYSQYQAQQMAPGALLGQQQNLQQGALNLKQDQLAYDKALREQGPKSPFPGFGKMDVADPMDAGWEDTVTQTPQQPQNTQQAAAPFNWNSMRSNVGGQAPQGGQAPHSQPSSKSLLGFGGNVIKSGFKTAMDIGSSLVNVINPNPEKNTLVNVGKLALGGAELLDPTKDNKIVSKLLLHGLPAPDHEGIPKALANFYAERYGGIDKATESFYNDPVGVALDASIVLGGVGSLTSKAGALSKSSTLAKTGSAISKAGEVINPITQASKVLPPIASKFSSMKQSQIEKSLARSSKAAPGAQEAFEDIAGKPVGQYMAEKGITDLSGAEKAIRVVQGMYDDMVKTNTAISGKKYADAIRARAGAIVESDRSPGARMVANKLLDEANMQEKLGNITDTVLTKTKTGQFGKVPGGVMTDPIQVNIYKELANAGRDVLENVAPGSSRVGKELQALQELKEILKGGGYKGTTTNTFGILKPAGVGATVGGAAGLALGGYPGAAVGSVLGGAATSYIDSAAGQRLIANALSKAQLPEIASKIPTQSIMNYGALQSRMLPNITTQSQGATEIPQAGVSPVSEGEYTYDRNYNTQNTGSQVTPTPQATPTLPPITTIGGRTAEQWYNESVKAYNAGYSAEGAQAFKFAQEAQKLATSGGKGDKALTEGQINKKNIAENGLRGLGVVKEILGYKKDPFTGKVTIDNIGDINKYRLTPMGLYNRKLGNAIFDAVAARLRIETGAAISDQEIKRYVDNYFLRLGDDPASVEYQLSNLASFLESNADPRQAATLPSVVAPQTQ